MVNAWSLLYDEYYGTMNKTYPIKKMSDENRVTPQESDEYDPIVTAVGSGSTDSAVFVDFNLNDQIDTISIDTSNYETLDLTGIELPDGMSVNQEYITGIETPTPGIHKDCTRKYKEDIPSTPL